MNITFKEDEKQLTEAEQKNEIAKQKNEAAYNLLIDVCDKTRLNEDELKKRLDKEVNDT